MLNGACLCDRIQYEITAKPRFMYQCHCGKCRAASGASYVTNIIVDAGSFRIISGEEYLAAFESSPNKLRHFCSRCGSPIYSQGEATKQFVSVRCGTLKQDPGIQLAYHAFVASKAAWVQIPDNELQFDEQPDFASVHRLFMKGEGM